ncbi:alpha-ketoacid dehydrogenase subunit beta [Alicyclobacillus tolerans]|uniref:alpha-ketoacid dehydrogenase subunit beta n=1 Tax=Alicyclobacillus tolerans TaxID=90970 RepID=UPI001F3053FA|nr:alpha-ketoacid dehydrogenase subunit beta [Alicyclobacillus tolerans]MCF8567640.1 alpha-ketoacid dehydrogenase subunit beta [Alicyclobacillus tolerans]
MPAMNMIQAINDALSVALQSDDKVMILGEDVGKNGGVFRATEGLTQRFGTHRVTDTPLAESGIIGTSIGLAVAGMKPIAEIQFLGFIYEAFDQVASQAARFRFRSQGRFTAPMVIRAPFGGGVRTPELHSDSLEALFLHTPGVKLVIPSNPYDAKGLILAAVADPDPVIVMEPMKLYRSHRMEVPEGYYEVPLGTANVLQEGDDITVIAWGPTVPIALEAAQRAKDEHNTSCEVIDLRSISPLDTKTVVESIKKTGRAVIVHEAVKTGGVGGELIAQVNEQAFLYLAAPIARVTGYDTPFPVPSIEDLWLPSVSRTLDAIIQTIEF